MKEKSNIFFYIFTMQVWSSDEILDSLAQTGGETLNNSIPVKTKKTAHSITYGCTAKSTETDG